ncbi:recombinase RecA [Candidatus Shikimatogenerans silvanidophilus]|uniref:recombinase RecA n=1 Tax=Candidatus Shikimatogenerans silvanidophilus TaxID=2782547 RepID=UPI001BA687B1|nr:recombinase RecA [Candidatus Shikimatogenerans silvanidophilus]
MKKNKENKENKESKENNEKNVKNERIRNILERMNKIYGKGTIMRMGDIINFDKIEVIPSGSIKLDIALGVGGYPKGRIVEIYGKESSGKTTLALHAISQIHKIGGVAAFIDAEHSFDSFYAEKLKVNVEDLIISQPDNGEQALEISDNLIRSGIIDIIVIDSVAALTPKSEIEGKIGENKIGLHARLMSQSLRKLISSIGKNKCLVIFINQIREKIGVFFGNPEVTTGGNALKFYSTIRIEIKKGPIIKYKDKIIGNRTKVKIVKNKVSTPFKIVEFDIIYGKGISRINEIIELSIDLGIIKKNGNWFIYNNNNIGQGKESIKSFFKKEEKILNNIEKKILNLKNKEIIKKYK